jgi:hypothetical protein
MKATRSRLTMGDSSIGTHRPCAAHKPHTAVVPAPRRRASGLTAAQRAYRRVKADFDRLEAARDRVLAPIDTSERTELTPAERRELDRIDRAQQDLYPLLRAAEDALLAAAYVWLARHPDALVRHPDHALLGMRPLPPGQVERAISLALRLARR